MLTAISYKSKQFSLLLLKIGIVVGAFYLIYHKIFHNSAFSFSAFYRIISNSTSLSLISVIFLLLLSYFNWYFEILKWQTLVTAVSKISFKKAKAQSLGALTASLWTPNRIGEYGAKAMYYPTSLRSQIMLLNLVGNAAQMLVTSVFGGLGLIYFSLNFRPIFKYESMAIAGLGMLVTGVLIVWIMNANLFRKYFQSFQRLVNFITNIPKKTMVKSCTFSVARYLIFSHQFYLLLVLIGSELAYLETMSAISTMYLLASIVPSIFLFDVVVKGGIAITIFGMLGISQPVVLTVVTAMWILNVVLPSLIGSYHVLQFKLPKSEA
ncbi:hypothetical protein ES711_03715 [Gelidibacter salicanalis]|uniref:Flippase-like domain-containing protein n=1 Tax=Gelidibacter salicanalis TaxID=291193 RepID=A0A5C7AT80_9FLAO|nr:hypothetical protein [Gelidibacter salicanalis]TXE09052.1 hypothetical protein ES711_03715 [Gelidibacter salicanalis]